MNSSTFGAVLAALLSCLLLISVPNGGLRAVHEAHTHSALNHSEMDEQASFRNRSIKTTPAHDFRRNQISEKFKDPAIGKAPLLSLLFYAAHTPAARSSLESVFLRF